jgi:hypothetical protein
MAARTDPSLSSLEATYKARDVEGIVDLYFYRRIAFHLARLFVRLKLTPTTVTLMGGVFGIAAGHFYYYQDLGLNVVGMFLHVCANTLDNADGQLARLLDRRSRSGRVIDSIVDHLIFLSIYLHLTLRCLAGGATFAILLVALAAGLSHALQGAAADYYRNGYLYFVRGRSRSDWDSSPDLRADYQQLSWRTNPGSKLLLRLYLNFTLQQEFLSPDLRRLRDTTERDESSKVRNSLRLAYRNAAQPMLKWWGLLMTNTRMLFLFIFLFMNRPAWFFWLELSVFNLLFIYLLNRQERMSRSLFQQAAVCPSATELSLP